jgi:hypothetical protein
MPEDFSFYCSYLGPNNEFDSLNSIFKRMYLGSDSAIKVILTPAEKAVIFNAFIKYEFESLPIEIPLNTSKGCITPAETDMLLVRMNSKTQKSIFSHACPPKNKASAIKFQNIIMVIDSVLSRKSQIRNLPPSDFMSL